MALEGKLPFKFSKCPCFFILQLQYRNINNIFIIPASSTSGLYFVLRQQAHQWTSSACKREKYHMPFRGKTGPWRTPSSNHQMLVISIQAILAQPEDGNTSRWREECRGTLLKTALSSPGHSSQRAVPSQPDNLNESSVKKETRNQAMEMTRNGQDGRARHVPFLRPSRTGKKSLQEKASSTGDLPRTMPGRCSGQKPGANRWCGRELQPGSLK